jgi:hypothetical protein
MAEIRGKHIGYSIELKVCEIKSCLLDEVGGHVHVVCRIKNIQLVF